MLRPLAGIESNKYQPIIRQLANVKVILSPCPMSPLTRRIFKNTEKKSIPPSTTNQKNGSTFISPDIENVQISNIKLNKDELLEE